MSFNLKQLKEFEMRMKGLGINVPTLIPSARKRGTHIFEPAHSMDVRAIFALQGASMSRDEKAARAVAVTLAAMITVASALGYLAELVATW